MIKNAFYFILKALVMQKALGHVKKIDLLRKIMLNTRFMTSQSG